MLDVNALSQISEVSAEINDFKYNQKLQMFKNELNLVIAEKTQAYLQEFDEDVTKFAYEGKKNTVFYDDVSSLLSLLHETDNPSILKDVNVDDVIDSNLEFLYNQKIWGFLDKYVHDLALVKTYQKLTNLGFEISYKNGNNYFGMDTTNVTVDWSRPLVTSIESVNFEVEITSLKEELENLKSVETMQEQYAEMKNEIKALKKENELLKKKQNKQGFFR